MNAPERMTAIATATQAVAQHLDPDFERLMARPFTQRELYEDANFEKMMRMAEMLAKGTMSIPKELAGKVGDCLAIVMQAMLWGLPPFAVAQCAHVINGKLGYEAKLVNAVVMNSGAIVGGFKYEYRGTGQGLQCRVGAVLRGESEITWNEWYGVSDALVKNSPLWKSNPAMQLGYVQVKFWVRAYAPGALLGIYTADELMDAEPMGAGSADAPAPKGPQRKSATAEAAAPAAGPAPNAEAPSEPPASMQELAPAPAPAPATDKTANDVRGRVSVGQVAWLRAKLRAANVAESAICARYEAGSLEDLTLEAFDELRPELV